MKKPILIAPRSVTREILPGADAERMLASGSWVLATLPKPVSSGAQRQRKYRHHRAEEGCKRLDVLLSERIFNALQAKRRKGESLAAMIERLLGSPDDSDEKG